MPEVEPAYIPHSRPTDVPGTAEAVAAVLASGQHAGGRVRADFEAAIARRVEVRHALAVQSGFAALHLALLALGVRRGSRVLVPSYVCSALLNAIAAAGGEPVVADVDAASFQLTSITARAALARAGLAESDLACAIVPHIFGYPAPLVEWNLRAPVIEDCAMALGARLGGREVGRFGRMAIFSFYATKMISTGQGGMVVTDDDALAREVRDLVRYDNRDAWRPCFNYPLPDLAAAVGLVQLGRLDEFLRLRRDHAGGYTHGCRGLPVVLQNAGADGLPSYHRFIVLARDAEARANAARALAAARVEAKSPVHRPLHRYLSLPPEDFPAAESIQARAISLPIYPSLSAADRARVIRALGGRPETLAAHGGVA